MTLQERIAQEFDRNAHYIERSLPYANGTYTLEDIRNACMQGQMQLWPGERCALISEICHYPQRTGCHVAFAGGNLDELKNLAPQVMSWARSKGCDFVSVQGRPGWVKALGFGRVVSTIALEDL